MTHKMGHTIGEFGQFVRKIEGETVDAQPVYLLTASGYNEEVVIQATGTALTETWNSAIQHNYSNCGMYIWWDILNQPVSGTVQLFVDLWNPATSDTACIFQSDAYSGTGTVTTLKKFLLYPGAIDDDSQLSKVDRIPVPLHWRIRLTHTPSGSPWNLSWAYSITVAYIP